MLLRLLARTPASAACEVARAAVVTHREEREELSGLKRLPVPFLRESRGGCGRAAAPEQGGSGGPASVRFSLAIMEWGTESQWTKAA